MFDVLLIEDDRTLFQEMQERLSQWSYEVHGVQDFGRVMERFTAVEPQLVIIDIQLPEVRWLPLVPHDPGAFQRPDHLPFLQGPPDGYGHVDEPWSG